MQKVPIDYEAADRASRANLEDNQVEILDNMIAQLDQMTRDEQDDPAWLAVIGIGSMIGMAYEQLDPLQFIRFCVGLAARAGVHPRAQKLVDANPGKFIQGEVTWMSGVNLDEE